MSLRELALTLPTTALRRTGPAHCLDSIAELTLVAGVGVGYWGTVYVSQPGGRELGERLVYHEAA